METSALRREQVLDRLFDLVVLAFAGVLEDDEALLVDDVLGRPILILVRSPRCVIVVLRYRILDAVALDGSLDVAERLFARELRRVHTNNDEALVFVSLVEPLHVRQRVDAVVASIGPEIDEDDLAAQVADAK